MIQTDISINLHSLVLKVKQLLCDRIFWNYTECPDTAYDKFISDYNNIFSETFPLLKTRFNKKYTKDEPWISTSLLAYSWQGKVIQNYPTEENKLDVIKVV